MTARKHRDASLEAHVRIRYPSEKRLDESVHALTGLPRHSGESLLHAASTVIVAFAIPRIIVRRPGQ